jgi:hypothetical protein
MINLGNKKGVKNMDIYYITNNPPQGDQTVEFDDGIISFQNGEVHQENGPAIVWKNGQRDWFLNGKRHRIDGPAVIEQNGKTEWWVNDKRHREDGPAFEHINGRKEWFFNGKPHRIDGPAVVDPEGVNEWFINGIQYTQENFPMNHVKSIENEIANLNNSELKKISKAIQKIIEIRESSKKDSVNKLKK